jgi:hypothetical protein
MNPKLVKIVLTKEQQVKLERSRDSISKQKMEKNFKGLCTKCRNIADYKQVTQIEDAQVIVRYCKEHKGLG